MYMGFSYSAVFWDCRKKGATGKNRVVGEYSIVLGLPNLTALERISFNKPCYRRTLCATNLGLGGVID